GSVRAVLRSIPSRKPKFEELGLPEVLERLSMERRGLLLVTGITGSGKSTTLAAMIDYINRTRNDHIITIEDPIEFTHDDIGCVVSQREIGHDSPSFATALRAALREDPDVILVGEMRDPETMSVALHAAATGHLVCRTLPPRTREGAGHRHPRHFPAAPGAADPRPTRGRHRRHRLAAPHPEDRRRGAHSRRRDPGRHRRDQGLHPGSQTHARD